MAVIVETYEDWGPAEGNRGLNRSLVTNANLKSVGNPDAEYYLYDISRPKGDMYGEVQNCSFTRYLSFKISGTYPSVKNVRMVIPKGFASDKWRVMYGLKSVYSAPQTSFNEFGGEKGVFDGTLNTLTDTEMLFPLLSPNGPEFATSHGTNYGANVPIWTQYLVLQFMAHNSTFNDVDNFGTEQIELIVEELEI